MNVNSTDFATLITGFLTDYLPLQRNYSKNTVLSYRDTLKLIVNYITNVKGINIQTFQLKSFTRELIIEFLEWYRNMGASSSAANQRLAAIKSFSEYAQIEKIELMAPLMEISKIKSKRAIQREVSYLTVEQIAELINKPSTNSFTEFRHRVIMTLLYDTGCRVQELCDLSIHDVYVGNPSTVRLHGKGNKTRTVVISDATANLVKEYLHRYCNNVPTDYPLITNRYNNKLDRDGIGYIINKYVEEVRKANTGFPEKVHCHMFRHSKAMHMLEAGINIVYIRDFLGHEDISTTMIYAKSNNRVKDDVISKLAPKVTDDVAYPDWSKDKDLMIFLNSLK